MTEDLKNKILSADDNKLEAISIPEWGVDVFIRVMPGNRRDFFESTLQGKDENQRMQNLRAKLAAFTLCDKDGNLIFREKDIEELGKKSSVVLDRIFAISSKINGLTSEDIEGLKKN